MGNPIFPGPIFPGPIFPEPIFPGTGGSGETPATPGIWSAAWDDEGKKMAYSIYEPITPSNSPANNFSSPSEAIYVGTGGNVEAVQENGVMRVIPAVPSGKTLEIRAIRINQTLTTASNMVMMRDSR